MDKLSALIEKARDLEPNPPFLLPGDDEGEVLVGLPVQVNRLQAVDYDHDTDDNNVVFYCQYSSGETDAFSFTAKSKVVQNVLARAETIRVFNINNLDVTDGERHGG